MTMPDATQHWLMYGGGVNSTALAILLIQGKFPQYTHTPWQCLFADTQEEKPETYRYVKMFDRWLDERGAGLTIVQGMSPMAYWRKYSLTGSRIYRKCTEVAKIKPIQEFLDGSGNVLQLIGIDAGESHRARSDPTKRYPLIEADIDRDGCVEIIKGAGLCVPVKSGCWCCPFARVGEVKALIRDYPDRVAEIVELERIATEVHGPAPNGLPRYQFGVGPLAEYVKKLAANPMIPGLEPERDMPCGCYDGGDDA